MASHTLKVTQAKIAEMQEHYQAYLQKPVPYSVFRAKVNGTSITAYTSGKVLFQGNSIEGEVSKWSDTTNLVTPSTKTDKPQAKAYSFENWSLIGNDEVGNGSYFGALTVCSLFLDKRKIELIKELGVKDSKLLTDAQIQDLAWQIKAVAPYHLIVCNPSDYNQAIDQGYNAVSIKVALHNKAINELRNKLSPEELNEVQGILIDQFTPERNYLKYLAKEANPIKDKLMFEKQAEGKHLAVAAASIIARDAFLQSLKDLGKEYNTILPSGAGLNVDKIGRQLVRKYGRDILKTTAKLHFKNTEKILYKS